MTSDFLNKSTKAIWVVEQHFLFTKTAVKSLERLTLVADDLEQSHPKIQNSEKYKVLYLKAES